MKRLFLLLITFLTTVTIALSQGVQVATLMHNGNVTAYYGADALVNAYHDAADNDVITLSSGLFQAVDKIEKGVSIRGSGFRTNPELQILPTDISGTMNISLPDSLKASMEGLHFENRVDYENTANLQFVNCYFRNGFVANGDCAPCQNLTFIYCILRGGDFHYGPKVFLINSVAADITTYDYSCSFQNCFLVSKDGNSSELKGSFYNCIFNALSDDGSNTPYNYVVNGVAYNSVSIKVYLNWAVDNKETFSNIDNNTNMYVDSQEELFKTFRGLTVNDITPDETFELTDSAAVKYLGADGTQVGIYGGSSPYTSKLSYPQISKFSVADKTDSDGNLKVNIEVRASE